jgi:hypothetical protein
VHYQRAKLAAAEIARVVGRGSGRGRPLLWRVCRRNMTESYSALHRNPRRNQMNIANANIRNPLRVDPAVSLHGGK